MSVISGTDRAVRRGCRAAALCALFFAVCALAFPSSVVLGDEQFELYLPLLYGKRTALFSNHTGICGDRYTVPGGTAVAAVASEVTAGVPFGTAADGRAVEYGEHILDALIARGAQVTVVFSPEHGFRGTQDAGLSVHDEVDARTGIPLVSLYGSAMHVPDAAAMDMFDTLVVDIQDVGLRYYTYYITLYHLMDACAAAGKNVIILDRPNPNGFYVDGPVLRDGYESGVGMFPMPTVYGMTLGELACMINGEGWLTAGRNACELTVIPCKNYTHRTRYAVIRAPSPNLKSMRAVYLYASVCFFENTAVSPGRGTMYPFELYGSPVFKDVPGWNFSFVPRSIQGALNPPFKGQTCWGRDLRGVPVEVILERGVDPSYVVDAYHACPEMQKSSFFGRPDRKGRYWIDLLSGSDELRTQITAGADARTIKESWQADLAQFRARRRPYLLYEE